MDSIRGQQLYSAKRKVDVTVDFNKLALEKAGIMYQLKKLEDEKKQINLERQKAALEKILSLADVQTQMQELYNLAGKLQLQQKLIDAQLAAATVMPIPKIDGMLPTLNMNSGIGSPAQPPIPPDVGLPSAGMPSDAGMPPANMPPDAGLPPANSGMGLTPIENAGVPTPPIDGGMTEPQQTLPPPPGMI